MTNESIARGDVVQIAPGDKVHNVFGGKLALVDEVRRWGVIAFVDAFEGRAYIRLSWESFERVGAAPFLPEDLLGEKEGKQVV